MKKKSLVLWASVFFLSVPHLAWSAPSRRRASPPRAAVQNENRDESPWYLFLGADLGYSHYSPYKDSLTEAPRGGSDLGVRALLAHYSFDWVIDGGLGYQVINNKGTNGDGSTNSDSTRNAYIDLSARYRFDDHWQLGPEFEYWLGTDKGLNPTVAGSDTIADGSNSSAWIGLQGLYEWTGDHKYRFGARALTGMNVADRTVVIVQAFFQIGFDVFGSSPPEDRTKNYERMNDDDLDRVESKNDRDPLLMTPEATPWPSMTPEPEPEVLTTPAPPEPIATPEPSPVPVVNAKKPPKMILTLDVNDLPFGFNNADLPKANANRVKKIGEFLSSHNGTWKALIVGGHTDERGTQLYNQKLSKRRADAVRSLLIEGGASSGKIRAVGYGENQPRDRGHTEKAWAKNRRVELEFKGVKDMVLMKKALNQ